MIRTQATNLVIETRCSPRLHLAFLDGNRGLTALYVVVFHLMMTQSYSQRFPPVTYVATCWLRYGHFAVDMFIVLSGYCLTLPVARSTDGRLPYGVCGFLWRRAKRIFPPYWSALCFTLLMILLVRSTGARARADDGSAFDAGNLLAHALMIHNWFPGYSGAINLPMWTVAIEWQIYFLFVGLLLPVWRLCGVICLLAVAIAIGELCPLLLPSDYSLSWTCPWYVGLFAIGMSAAVVSVSIAPALLVTTLRGLPWGSVFVSLLLLIIGVELVGGNANATNYWPAKDLLVGTCSASLLIFLANEVTGSKLVTNVFATVLVRLLQSRAVVSLGSFSYSLYLIHMPLMWPVKFVAQSLKLSPNNELLYRLTLAPLAMLPVAYLFHRVFERPFMSAASFKEMPVAVTADKIGVSHPLFRA